MNSIEEKISWFRGAANDLLNEQVVELNRYKESNLLSGKLARITTFNSQLEVFKRKLNEQIQLISGDVKTDAGSAKLKSSLVAVSEEFISEFMCMSFVKDST